jgi:hypothetical protein
LKHITIPNVDGPPATSFDLLKHITIPNVDGSPATSFDRLKHITIPNVDGSPATSEYKDKAAKTLREKRSDASWADIVLDNIDSSGRNTSSTAIKDLVQDTHTRGESLSAVAKVYQPGVVFVDKVFGGMSFEESIQQDYAVPAMELIESKTHRELSHLYHGSGAAPDPGN